MGKLAKNELFYWHTPHGVHANKKNKIQINTKRKALAYINCGKEKTFKWTILLYIHFINTLYTIKIKKSNNLFKTQWDNLVKTSWEIYWKLITSHEIYYRKVAYNISRFKWKKCLIVTVLDNFPKRVKQNSL